MNQSDLCFSIDDALKAATRALGGAKALGHRLRPELDPDAAGRWWLDCVNEGRNAKPSLSQVLTVARWARDRGCHDVVRQMCREAGYSEPDPITPDDEQAELKRQFVAAVATLERLQGVIASGAGVRR